jgi:hypothetical protein
MMMKITLRRCDLELARPTLSRTWNVQEAERFDAFDMPAVVASYRGMKNFFMNALSALFATVSDCAPL